MKNGLALLIKFGLVAIVVLSIFTAFRNVTIVNALVASVLLVALSYWLGDMLILRRFGNVMASLADFALAFLVLFFYGIMLGIPAGQVGNAAGLSALFIAFGEAFFHFYLMNNVFGEKTYTDEDKRHVRQISSDKLQTETSDEVFPYSAKKNRKKDEDK